MVIKNKLIFLLLLILGFSLVTFAKVPKNKSKVKNNGVNQIATNDLYDFIAINQCKMWLSNNGDGSYNPISAGSGFYWPGGPQATISAIFEDGLIFGGLVNGEIRVGGSTYRHGLQAGKILDDGTAAPAENDRYRIYKIRKDWQDLDLSVDNNGDGIPDKVAYEKDYNEWPVEDGAPWVDVDGDGVFTRGVDQPEFVGDEVLWFVANDLDPSRTQFLYGTQPMGLEIQSTTFAFNRTGDLGDIVFKKYLIINKGTNTIEDMYLAYWSDTDLGDANDDFSGCDTVLSLGYTYNGDNDDAGFYGVNPPAIGYDFFQGPIVPGEPDDVAKFKGQFRPGFKNLPMTGYSFYINGSSVYSDPDLGTAAGAEQMYNYLRSLLWNGNPFIDPHSGLPVKFCLAGDPVNGTGWYEGPGWPGGEKPGDRRHLMSSGPFTMAPGDTQEVVVGIIIGRSSSNIKSVKELKIKDQAAQFAYDADFQLPSSPPAPKTHFYTGDGFVNFWWQDNAESYDNRFYTFEGYRIFQFRNQAQSIDNGELLQIFDKKNDVGVIEDFVKVAGERIIAPVIQGSNTGIFRTYEVTSDAYTNGTLKNANPYYFAITSYAVAKSPDITPAFLESPPKIVEVIPGRHDIDDNFTIELGDSLLADHSSGFADGFVKFDIVDPSALKDVTYDVTFDTIVVNDTTGEKALAYSLVNSNSGDTLINNSLDFSPVVEDKEIVDGFLAIVNNFGQDSLSGWPHKYRVRDILEVVDENGNALSSPVNVYRSKFDTSAASASGEWYVTAGGTKKDFVWQKKKDDEGLGFDYYEIRFTGTSEYYITGEGFAPRYTKDDPKGKGVLPFEIWDIGRDVNSTADDKRLIIKVLDKSLASPFIQDSSWSQVEDGTWEELVVYETDAFPADNLPATSGTSDDIDHKFAHFAFHGNIPAAGSGAIIRMRTYQGLTSQDKFSFVSKAQNSSDANAAKNKLDQISVFPNPYFGANALETSKYLRFVRFTGLPTKAIIRIFSLSGVFIKRIDKDGLSQYVDWNLKNKDEFPVASGVYIAYIDMPGIGTKVLKIAVILEQQYIDRL